MKKTTYLAILALLVPSALGAQVHHLEALVAPHLYPPELLRQSQRQLNLSEEQEAAIRSLTLEFQAVSAEIQWDMEASLQALVPLVTGDQIDVEATLGAFDEVLEMEAQIKRGHLRLLMELKNVLNPEQLLILRREMEAHLSRDRGGEGHEGGSDPDQEAAVSGGLGGGN